MRVSFGLLWVIIGCGEPEEDDFCENTPVMTWESFGQDFIQHNCQACHASTTGDRHGAPESMVFDTYDQVLSSREVILERVFGSAADMPPSGGVDEDELWRAEVWLRCNEE